MRSALTVIRHAQSLCMCGVSDAPKAVKRTLDRISTGAGTLYAMKYRPLAAGREASAR